MPAHEGHCVCEGGLEKARALMMPLVPCGLDHHATLKRNQIDEKEMPIQFCSSDLSFSHHMVCRSEDTQFYSFEVLSGPPPYPEGVDPARRELHLSDANFLDIFGKSKQEFAAIPAWKRDLIKKKKKLF